MVGLIDCDNFFCSCERVFRPDLINKPIVVLSNNDGCVVARSKEVKAMGIPDCLPYYQLAQQYPDSGIIAFSSNYALYGDMSSRVMAVLRSEVPEVYQYSIDEAFLDLSGMGRVHLKKWGEALCRKVYQYTGMPVSLGIASTKTLAKLASFFAKKYPGYNKCCFIETEEQRVKALSLMPVKKVWGIGRRMTRMLDDHGIKTAYDYARINKRWIRDRFNITGERTWHELNGFDVIDIDNMDGYAKQTILTSRSFPRMITEINDLKSHVANYAARCALKLRKQKSVCGMVTVFIQSNRFRDDLWQYGISRCYSFSTPTDTTPEIVGAAVGVLDGIYKKNIYYKRAGVIVSGMSSAYAIQPDLFSYNHERFRKFRAVSHTLDVINGRMGADTVVLASQQYRDTEASGKSVKFVNAIRRAMKSPDYSTTLDAFRIG
ncbi:MAG: Y-family DNA polymerase [Paramuribaculum sp.]|nr:Y-family DNA polymerase [Paramuribaculum sp.]